MFYNYVYDFGGWNKKLFILINNATNKGIIPYIMQIFSQAFNISSFAAIYILTLLYAIYYLTQSDQTKKRQIFSSLYTTLSKIGLTYAIFGCTYAILKFSINLPRPFCSLSNNEFYTIANTTHERCLSGFPSSHSGLAILLLYFLWPYLKYTYYRVIALTVVVIVATSRITLAMHYPADILYGMIIACIVIQISKLIYSFFENNLIKYIGQNLYHIFIMNKYDNGKKT